MSGGLTNPQGWNRYSYVANDPVNFTDSTGLQRDGCGDAEMENDPYCVYKRGGSGRWGIGMGSYWNGEYWSNFWAPIWIPSPTPGGGGGGSYSPPGHNGALRALERENCYKLFGFKSHAEAQRAFSKVEFRAADLGRLQVTWGPNDTLRVAPGTPPPAQTERNTITINTAYNWFTFRPSAVHVVTGAIQTFDYLSAVNSLLNAEMTTADLAVLILLHEFRHTPLGGNAPQETSDEFIKYNAPIYENCLKK
jgi:hypothetical protein